MINPNWKTIGFQANNPRTDFRGGGILSLMCLVFLVENYPTQWEEMVASGSDESKMWLLAISSINITHNLIVYFHMHDYEVPEHYKKVVAGRAQFKKFCHLNYITKKAFFELHRFALMHLHYEWLILVKHSGKPVP